MKRNRTTAPLLLTAAMLLSGCSPETLESVGKDTQRNAEIVAREAKRAEKNARPTLRKLNLGARVTAAIQANQKLPRSIRVDASETGVYLRGAVKSEGQKELAERIARDTLDEKYTVQNDLKVDGG
ncbi:MAG: BON domain-containing protein [Cytophagales bacterium]|nr:BON domain-containing protein [Armatimonadota bacterium]